MYSPPFGGAGRAGSGVPRPPQSRHKRAHPSGHRNSLQHPGSANFRWSNQQNPAGERATGIEPVTSSLGILLTSGRRGGLRDEKPSETRVLDRVLFLKRN